LIDEYGYPTFVKIDVEGYEFEVLSGLSKPIRALSIEFTPEYLENTLKCIHHICRISEAEFQISLGESIKFSLPEWVSAEGVKKQLRDVNSKTFGDLYVKCNF